MGRQRFGRVRPGGEPDRISTTLDGNIAAHHDVLGVQREVPLPPLDQLLPACTVGLAAYQRLIVGRHLPAVLGKHLGGLVDRALRVPFFKVGVVLFDDSFDGGSIRHRYILRGRENTKSIIPEEFLAEEIERISLCPLPAEGWRVQVFRHWNEAGPHGGGPARCDDGYLAFLRQVIARTTTTLTAEIVLMVNR